MSDVTAGIDARQVETIVAGPHMLLDADDRPRLIRGVWEYQMLPTREPAAVVWVETAPRVVHPEVVELDRVRIMPGRPS